MKTYTKPSVQIHSKITDVLLNSPFGTDNLLYDTNWGENV